MPAITGRNGTPHVSHLPHWSNWARVCAMIDPGPAEEHLAPSQALGETPLHGAENRDHSQNSPSRRSATMRLGEWIVTLAGSYALIGGMISLLGWVLEVPRFKDWTGAGVTMKANAAICAASGGLALLLSFWNKGTILVRICTGIVLLVGSLTLLQH